MKKLRQSTAEPVFGTLINFMALKRINTRDHSGRKGNADGSLCLQPEEVALFHPKQKENSRYGTT